MSDLFLSTQQQLTQALTQLNRLSTNSPVVQQVKQVIVQQLAGNQLVLGNGQQQQRISLSRPQQASRLQQGQNYWVSIGTGTQQQQSQLVFFSTPPSGTEQNTVLLDRNQLQTILNITSGQIQPNSQTRPVTLPGVISQISDKALVVQVKVQGKNVDLKINVKTIPANIQPGQTVQLQLSAKQDQWHLAIQDQTKNPILVNLRPSASDISTILNSDKLQLSARQHNLAVQISPAGVDKLVQSRSPNLSQIEPVRNAPLKLSVIPNLGAQLISLLQKPVATVALSQEQIKQLSTTLQITADNKSSLNNLPGKEHLTSQERQIQNQSDSGKEVKTKQQNESMHLQTKLDNKESVLLDKVRMALENINSGQSKISSGQTASVLPMLQQQVQSLLRQVAPQALGNAELLKNIEQALVDDKLLLEPDISKPVLDKLIKQLEQSNVQGRPGDAAQIKQLLTQPTFNLTPTQLVQPQGTTGLLSGLLTILQISLAARLGRTEPALAERLSQIITSSVSTGATKLSPQAANRTLQDFNQLEQKHQLLKHIGRLFSQHQSSKLGNAEQLLQGQESFYYVLPVGVGNDKRDIELLIRREQEKADKQANKSDATKAWNLTMKLSVGSKGEMLTKAKLLDDTLEIDVYTSNNELKDQVIGLLPLLKKRFSALGIEVQKSQCQLGKIPQSLQNRPYHLFQTKA